MAKKKTLSHRKPNINDVALAAGVSKSTVSNFLNQRSSHFSTDTEERIRKAMRELRYIPDPGARSIKNQDAGKILGIILRETFLNVNYYHHTLSAICEALSEQNYRALIIPDSGDFDRDVMHLRELAKGLISGYFLFNIHEKDDPYVNALTRENIRFVCVGYNSQIDNFVASRQDNGWESAARHLIEKHGAKRIAVLPGKPETNVQKDRIKGYRSALDANGISFDRKLVLHEESGEQDMIKRLGKMLPGKNPPDSVILPHALAENVMEVLFELGMRMPRDLRLVVYDTPFHMIGRQFAHIQLRLPSIGREAVMKMMTLLQNDKAPSSGVFIDVDFLPGRSCGCVDASSIRLRKK